jgi:phospholipid transport system substrate-binding protein
VAGGKTLRSPDRRRIVSGPGPDGDAVRPSAGLAALTAAVFATPAPAVAERRADVAPDEFIRKVSVDILDQIRSDKEILRGGQPPPHRRIRRPDGDAACRLRADDRTDHQAQLAPGHTGSAEAADDRVPRAADPHLLRRPEPDPRRTDPPEAVSRRAAQTMSSSAARSSSGGATPSSSTTRLERGGSAWKIYDLNVLGVWLVKAYRDRFSQEISAKGLDGLIQKRLVDNKAFDEQPARKG